MVDETVRNADERETPIRMECNGTQLSAKPLHFRLPSKGRRRFF